MYLNGKENEDFAQQNQVDLQGNYEVCLSCENTKYIFENINKYSNLYFSKNDVIYNNDSVENNHSDDNQDFDDNLWVVGKKFEEMV